MTSFRDIKRTARRDRHLRMSLPAFYYPALQDPPMTPVECTVRLWLRVDEMSGSQIVERGSAEMAVSEDRIRLRLAELPGAKARTGAIVSVAVGEAYRIDHLYETDDEFQTARVTRLSATAPTGLAVPE